MRAPRRLTDKAKAIWKRTVPAMEAAGLLVDADRTILELYCATMADVEELEEDLATTGRIITTPNGHKQPSPSWSQLRQARQDAAKFAIQLGMTPKARKQMGIVGKDDDDDSEDDFK